jgi:formamidopyrimidine-DNA glycosylase
MGTMFTQTYRKGKYILIYVENKEKRYKGSFVLHFGMTGSIQVNFTCFDQCDLRLFLKRPKKM